MSDCVSINHDLRIMEKPSILPMKDRREAASVAKWRNIRRISCLRDFSDESTEDRIGDHPAPGGCARDRLKSAWEVDLDARPSQQQAHLMVAGVRVLEHQQNRPPSVDELASLLEMSREVAQMIRDMKKLDPSRFRGNPELVEELITQVLPGLEQIELRLRRELEGDDAGQVKAVLSRPVPAGYADAVAEYYRKLSRGQ